MIKRLLVLAVVMSSLVRPSQAQADLTSEVRPYKDVPDFICQSEDNLANPRCTLPVRPSDFTDFANAVISTFDFYLRFLTRR